MRRMQRMRRMGGRAAICVALVGCKPAAAPAVPVDPVSREAVKAKVAAFAGRRPISRIERQQAGPYTLHVAHLEQEPVADDEVWRFSDAQYVVVEHRGVLAELGVLALIDESRTHLKRGASFMPVGAHASAFGPLLVLRRSTWWVGDGERTRPVYGTAVHEFEWLLVCRWTGTLRCAEVPLAVVEVPDGQATMWQVRVEVALAEAGGFVFTLQDGEAAAADELGLPRGRVDAAELFARHPTVVRGEPL